MGANFPAAPADGEIFVMPNTTEFEYRGGVWRFKVPVSPLAGDAPFDGRIYGRKGSIWTPQRRENRGWNRMVNATFLSNQDVGTAAQVCGLNTALWAADMWQFHNLGNNSTVNIQLHADGAERYAGLWGTPTTTSLPPNAYVMLLQNIEGYRLRDVLRTWTAGNNRAIGLALRFQASASGPNAGSKHAVAIRAANGTRSFLSTFVPDLNAKFFTIKVPPDTSGSFPIVTDNNAALGIYFTLAAGSDRTASQSNQWLAGNLLRSSDTSQWTSVANPSFYISKVGLYADPGGYGEPPEWAPLDIAEDIIEIMRYYQRSGSRLAGVSYSGGPGVALIGKLIGAPMRAAPAISIAGTGPLFLHSFTGGAGTGAQFSISSIAANNSTPDFIYLDVVANGSTWGNGKFVMEYMGQTAHFVFDARI